ANIFPVRERPRFSRFALSPPLPRSATTGGGNPRVPAGRGGDRRRRRLPVACGGGERRRGAEGCIVKGEGVATTIALARPRVAAWGGQEKARHDGRGAEAAGPASPPDQLPATLISQILCSPSDLKR
uniref:Uncharacterized protein n=1 Tax=Aegilops tauschii subsp. strangulata TaxID=200361 RepID=A0A453GPK3_AEGTS